MDYCILFFRGDTQYKTQSYNEIVLRIVLGKTYRYVICDNIGSTYMKQEPLLPKLRVASSNLVFRSRKDKAFCFVFFYFATIRFPGCSRIMAFAKLFFPKS